MCPPPPPLSPPTLCGFTIVTLYSIEDLAGYMLPLSSNMRFHTHSHAHLHTPTPTALVLPSPNHRPSHAAVCMCVYVRVCVCVCVCMCVWQHRDKQRDAAVLVDVWRGGGYPGKCDSSDAHSPFPVPEGLLFRRRRRLSRPHATPCSFWSPCFRHTSHV